MINKSYALNSLGVVKREIAMPELLFFLINSPPPKKKKKKKFQASTKAQSAKIKLSSMVINLYSGW